MIEQLETNPQKNREVRIGGLQVLTLVLLIISVGLNVVLARRSKALSNALLNTKAEHALTVGSTLPPIEASDLKHNLQIIDYDSTTLPTVFYVFSPQCGWCTKNAPNLRVLAKSIKGRYRLLGLSLSSAGLNEYVATHGMDFPIYTDLSAKSVVAYRLGGTPTTLVVSADGKLLREWKGAYMGQQQNEIEEYFGVSLHTAPQTKE